MDKLKDCNDAYVATLEVDDDIEHESRRYNDTAQSVNELLQQAQRALQTTEEAAAEAPDAPPPDVPPCDARPQRAPQNDMMDDNAIKIRMKKIKLQAQMELDNLRMMRLDPESDDDADRQSVCTPPSIPSESSTILQQQKQLLDLLDAPKLEIPVFDGSPLQYYQFIRAFKDNVERIVPEHSSRLA